MTIQRTMHMAVAIRLFEQMDDKVLSECFNNEPVENVRSQLAEWRAEGFTFVPCHCGHYDSRGACTGTGIVKPIKKKVHKR